MAFTIPDLTDDKLNPVQTRNGDQPATNDEVKFHRHCQKTILSAYGPDGNGLTWNTINNLDLPNLPATWRDNFTSNTNNITEDLKALLNLINDTAGKKGKFTIKFIDVNDRNIETLNVNLESDNPTYTVKFGRVVELKIGDNGPTAAKFNTVKSNSGVDSLTIPTKNISFALGSTTLGSMRVVSQDNDDVAVTIPCSNAQIKLGSSVLGTIPTPGSEDSTVVIPYSTLTLKMGVKN